MLFPTLVEVLTGFLPSLSHNVIKGGWEPEDSRLVWRTCFVFVLFTFCSHHVFELLLLP